MNVIKTNNMLTPNDQNLPLAAERKPFRFRVIAGFHVHVGKVYETGQIIEHDRDLRKAHPGKFELVEDTDD